MVRKKKEEEIIEEVVEETVEALPESLKGLADDDSPSYSWEEEKIEEELEEVFEETEEIVEDEFEEAVEEIIEVVVQAFVEFDSAGEIDLAIPMREQEWDDDVFVIDEVYAERMLTNASARLRKSHGKVAFAGHERQNRFLAFLAAQMLRGEGNVLYLPEELADYEPLQELEKVDDAPEGFVAFSAK